MKPITLLLLFLLSIACNSQEKEVNKTSNSLEQKYEPQIGEYVTSAFEDSKGHLWFGTLSKGIARFDGQKLRYFTKVDGLPSDRVTGVIEDSLGVFWFMTGAGLSKFDGAIFTNFSISDGFSSNIISKLFIDRKGVFWIGTWGGVYQFDGHSFMPFPIPYPTVSTPINNDTKDWITEIIEDSEGTIWFARDGYGICKYDGKSFAHLLTKDGLHSNNITEMEIDKEGNIWIGSRVAEKDNPDPTIRFGKGGINKLTHNEIISFPEIEGFNESDVHEIFKDNSDHIWISTLKNGVYRYDGIAFKNYEVPISIMGMTNDRQGILWLAGAGGLYKIDQKDAVINVTTKGPWK